jgi:hypothetical protein
MVGQEIGDELKWLQLMLVAVQIEKNHEKLSQNNWF